MDQHIVTYDPVRDISPKKLGIEKHQDTRYLLDHEIEWFFTALERTRTLEKNKIYLELLLFYGCRPIELREANISQLNFDFGLWSIPWQQHKTGSKTKQPLVRPITKDIEHLWKRAIELSGSKKWVFSNENSKDCLSRSAVAACVRNLSNYWTKKITDENGEPVKFEHWTLYSLRKTARTNFSNWGDWVVCEKMVGHKMGGESDKYDYNTYAHKMIPVYDSWYAHLDSIRSGKSNIVQIKKRATQ